jgi:hypothetical protein
MDKFLSLSLYYIITIILLYNNYYYNLSINHLKYIEKKCLY